MKEHKFQASKPLCKMAAVGSAMISRDIEKPRTAGLVQQLRPSTSFML